MPESTEALRRQKRRKAVRSAALGALIQVGTAVLLLWMRADLIPEGGFFSGLLLILALVDLATVIPVAIVLRQRLGEIDTGEEEEARRY